VCKRPSLHFLLGLYRPGYVILSGQNPSVILARSSSPLALPSEVWEDGVSPYTCNVANVTFLEAAEPLGNDAFRIYFGGADAVVGTAVVEVSD